MVNLNALSSILSWDSAAWATFVMLGAALFAAWPRIMGQRNDRRRIAGEEKASDWSRLREENARLHGYLAECEDERAMLRDDLADERAERKRLEAIMLGIGEGKQIVQAGLSADRIVERDAADKRAKKRDKPDG